MAMPPKDMMFDVCPSKNDFEDPNPQNFMNRMPAEKNCIQIVINYAPQLILRGAMC
jgi:hypothetical protein